MHCTPDQDGLDVMRMAGDGGVELTRDLVHGACIPKPVRAAAGTNCALFQRDWSYQRDGKWDFEQSDRSEARRPEFRLVALRTLGAMVGKRCSLQDIPHRSVDVPERVASQSVPSRCRIPGPGAVCSEVVDGG